MGISNSIQQAKDAVAEDMAKARDESMEIMISNQKKLQMRIRETQMAVNIGFARDNFKWYAAFYSVVSPLCIIGAVKTKKPVSIIPLIPLSFALAFQYDMAYGDKLFRVRYEAEMVLEKEREKFLFPENTKVIRSREEYESFFVDKDDKEQQK
mmetsp:Transcript_328/g.458  ORF Transcript_328/g.458 Transcript_328/m.458 type:complete len:153 (-) Transcript_328:41-499(-)